MAFYRVMVDMKDGHRDMFEGAEDPAIEAGGLMLRTTPTLVWISTDKVDRWAATRMDPDPEPR